MSMNNEKWRQRYVCLQDQSVLAVYHFYSPGRSCHDGDTEKAQWSGRENEGEIEEEDGDTQREVVLMIAGCGNTVSVYTMLEERSLPDYLFANNFDVWAMDCRGHGESSPPPGCRQWDVGTYSFIDVNTVIDYVLGQTGAVRLHLIGHSMGGMMSMALISHPELHKKILSVTAIGSTIYLENSIGRLIAPFLPIVKAAGGIDIQLGTELFGKIWSSLGNDDPTCGNGGNGSCSAEDVMASHENSGSKRTYDFMQHMFCFEPVGVMEDFFEALSGTGLKLKRRGEPKREKIRVEINTKNDPSLITADNWNKKESMFSEHKVNINEGGNGSRPHVIDGVDAYLVYDNYDDEYDVLELHKTIGRFNQRILLINGTEDQLVVPADVEKCYDTICRNAKNVYEESEGKDSSEGIPTIYTVGKAVGGDKPYSHFDMLFGEDAPKNIFPAILAFLEGQTAGRYTIP